MEYKLSPTKLNLLEECPRCFWLAVVKKVERPSGMMASIVIKMDSIIKHYFDKYRKLNQLPPIIAGKLNGTLPKNMPKTLYFDNKNGIMLMGRPDDYIELENGSIVAFDHKTRSKPPEEMNSNYQLQMDVYSFLIQANGFKTTNKAFLAYYYPDDCDIHNGMDIHCKIIEVKTNPARVEKLLEKANSVMNGKMPENGSECEFCKWLDEVKSF